MPGFRLCQHANLSSRELKKTFAVNHLGHFLLTKLLLLRMARRARVIFTSSGTHDPNQKTGLPEPRFPSARLVAHPEEDTFYDHEDAHSAGQRHYTTSKLCNIICAYELARRLQAGTVEGASDLWVAAFDPGMMPGTGLARTYPWFMQMLWKYVLPMTRVAMKNANSPERSGQRLAQLGAEDYQSHKSGLYFEGLEPIRSSDVSYNQADWEDLWKLSETLTSAYQDDGQ